MWKVKRVIWGMAAVAVLLSGCSVAKKAESQSSISVAGERVQRNISEVSLQLLEDIMESAKEGRINGVDIPLRSTYGEVASMYGQPKTIGNNECWTYSYDHPKSAAAFYYEHDSCNSEAVPLQNETIVNQIAVSPEFYGVPLIVDEVKQVFGKPDEEFTSEAYGGHYLVYKIDSVQLRFVAEEESSSQQIYQISVSWI
ncbi:DUF4309 domain-containing protein [uncultured Brevibacillus sp.]|uniref:DUF4309 domain-containing protein n=1 Tax=uncultured Brevibacillus sp. TaxID=169970 RepID=UPI0025961F99|nr:DUF4309 domain-containing protein [uncultured Brevibacillus sp.]